MGLVGGIATVVLLLHIMWPVVISCQTALASVASSGALHLQVIVMSLGSLYGTCAPPAWAVPVAAC